MSLVEVWRDEFTSTRRSVLSVYAQNSNGTGVLYGPLSTGAHPDGTRFGVSDGVLWIDNNHNLARPDADRDGISDTAPYGAVPGIGPINLVAVAFHGSRKSPGFVDDTVTNSYEPLDLRNGEVRIRMRLESVFLPPSARIAFWFQTFDTTAGPYYSGGDVNYMQDRDFIDDQLGITPPLYAMNINAQAMSVGGPRVPRGPLTTKWVDVVVPLTPDAEAWRAMGGNASKNNSIYFASKSVERALKKWCTDFGIIVYLGPNDVLNPAERVRGQFQVDSMSLWLPEEQAPPIALRTV